MQIIQYYFKRNNVCRVNLVLHHRHVIILIKIFNQFDNDQIYS